MVAARRLLVMVLALFAAAPGAADAAFSVSATWERIGEKQYRLTVRNDGDPFKTMFLSPVPHSGCTIAPPGSCGPNGDDEIRYTLAEPLPTGQSATGEFTTSTELADGTVLKLRVRQENTDSDYFDVPQKSTAPPPEPQADLEVTFSTARPVSLPAFLAGERERTAVQVVTVIVTNHGPAAANDVGLTVDLKRRPSRSSFTLHESRERLVRDPATGIISSEYDWVDASGCSSSGATRVGCAFGTLQPGERRSRHVLLIHQRPGAVELEAQALSTTRDPGPRPNTRTFTSTIAEREISDIGPIDLAGSDTFSGRASANVRVQLAVVQMDGGATGQPRSLMQAADPRCRWLEFSSAFRIEHDDRCDEPVWLKTKSLGKGRFRLKLRKKLKPGRYRLIAHTVGDDGTRGVGRRAVRSFRIR